MANDLARETLELGAWPDAEVVHEDTTRALVRLERFGLSARPVQGEHEPRHQLLAVGVLVHQTAKLPDDLPVMPESQVRIHIRLDRPEPKVVEVSIRAAVHVQRDAGEDRAVPEIQSPLRSGRGTLEISSRDGVGRLFRECRKDPRIQVRVADLDPIPASSSFERDAVGCELMPKPRDVRLEAVRRRRRWARFPDLVDQSEIGDDLTCTKEERSENRSLLPTAELERAIADLGLESPENTEPELL